MVFFEIFVPIYKIFLVLGLAFLEISALNFKAYNGKDDAVSGLLFPRESETRDVKSLDGFWSFIKSDINNPNEGIDNKWYSNDLSKFRPTFLMPVPASYNDITEQRDFRDHVGTVWYDRKFFISPTWSNKRIWIRFGSVHYAAQVWVNGEPVVKHEIGHLPFETEITNHVKYSQENRITIVVDNVLNRTTIPQGRLLLQQGDTGLTIVQTYSFDFFNYAGIQRSVYLYTTPLVHIEDVTIRTETIGRTGRVHFNIRHSTAAEQIQTFVQIKDKEGNLVGNKIIKVGDNFIDIDKANLWWPYLMDPVVGYLYTLEVFLQTTTMDVIDVYRIKFGIRTIRWNTKQVLINGKPIYFRGFGKHEDSDVRGKGLDLPFLTRDMVLLKWVGANSYRTSHYPYSEESMDFADEHGIMIIDESPSVDTEEYTLALLKNHKSAMRQLIHRDKNHPSVIMWSLANEYRANNAENYFRDIANYTRTLDYSRPITASTALGVTADKAVQFFDVISFNRYNAWYSNTGQLNMVTLKVIEEANAWHTTYNKPIIMSEYGADTLEGLHILPSFVWTEDFQVELFSKHFEAFDILRGKEYFIGEFIWNFADFKTNQEYHRVAGNKKGIFTRQRQPKAAAHHVRKRYFALAKELDNHSLPEDLHLYIKNNSYSRDRSEF